jgi:hypothetical protein
VELLNRLLGMGAILVFDERKAPGTSGLTVDRHDHLRRWRDAAEVGAKICFSSGVRQIADEQADGQSTLS